MVWVATGPDMTAAELLSRVVHEVPDQYQLTSRGTSWGAWAVGSLGSSQLWRIRGRWLVAGWPNNDPWGLGTSIGFDQVIDDLDRFGPIGASMISGPAVALNIDTGGWATPLNSLMAPGPMPGDHQILTTASSKRRLDKASQPIGDSSPAFSSSGLAREVEGRRPLLGGRFPLIDPTAPKRSILKGVDWSVDVFETSDPSGLLVSAPRNLEAVYSDPVLFEQARRVVAPDLTWRAARLGRELASPHFERPALDQVGFGWAIGASI